MKIYSHTHIGKRKYQQDSFRMDPESGLFLVCDGVGGSDQGAFASRWVSDYIYERRSEIKDENTLTNILMDANQFLKETLKIEFPGQDGHTTIALVKFWSPTEFSILNIGDTRVYLLDAESSNIWHTKDHTLLQQMMDHHVASEDVLTSNHPFRHQLTTSIGTGSLLKINDISLNKRQELRNSNVILICSDGVWELIDEVSFLEDLKKEDMPQFISTLKSKINEFASDNATFILLDLRYSQF